MTVQGLFNLPIWHRAKVNGILEIFFISCYKLNAAKAVFLYVVSLLEQRNKVHGDL